MSNSMPTTITYYVGNLIEEANRLLSVPRCQYDFIDDKPGFLQFTTGCRNLAMSLGPHFPQWTEVMEPETAVHMCSGYHVETVERLLGLLRSLQQAITAGVLQSVIELIRAETFQDLLAQADYLLESGFALPAAVICRAVLEDHLRNCCIKVNAIPTKSRATIEDFRQALQKLNLLSKSQSLHVTALAAIGNDAAHGKHVGQAEAERLAREVRMLVSNSVGAR